MPVNILLYTELVIISFVRSLFSPKLNYRVVLSNQLIVIWFGDLSPVPFDYLVSLALNVRVGKIFFVFMLPQTHADLQMLFTWE